MFADSRRMASKPITIAIQSQEGQKRVQVSSTAKTEDLYKNVQKLFDLTSCQFTLYKKQNKTFEVANSRTKTVKGEGLNHGDRLFMFPKTQNLFQNSESSSSSSQVPSVVIEDELDQELAKLDGKIPKNKNNPNSMTTSDLPYDPFDEEYLKSQNIKFMSFHSYIRKMNAGMSKGKFTTLRNLSCKRAEDSQSSSTNVHLFQKYPSAITLNRQPWRHVDGIMFENPQIVDRYLQFWR